MFAPLGQLLLPLLTLSCQAPGNAAAPAGTAVFGTPVSVRGERISDEEIRRFLCHGLGSMQVQYFKVQILIDQELERRRAQGEDVSKYTVTDEALERSVEKQKRDFLLRYPTLDFPTEVSRALLSVDLFRESARQALEFDRLFLPENPDEWPDLTTEIIRQQGGDPFVEDAKTAYQARLKKQIDEGLEEIPPDDPIFTDTLKAWVLEALNNYAVQQTDPARLPPGVLMTVEEKPVPLAEVWRRVERHATPDLVEDARRFLALAALIQKDLAEKGVLLSRPEWEKEFAKDKPLQEMMANHQMLALQVRGMPSMEAYVEYNRLMDSFKRLIKDDLASNEKLNEEIPACNLVAGAAKVDCEVILCSAYDFDRVRWKDDGWTDAARRAKELKKALDGGADWTQTLQLHSQFWDAPLPETGQKPQHGFFFKGKFGQRTRNDLRNYLLEGEFRSFVHGRTLTDRIFFDQPVGTISEPMKGPRGYYIARVIGRTPPVKPLDLAIPIHRQIAESHYAVVKFERYSWKLLEEALAKGDVTGI